MLARSHKLLLHVTKRRLFVKSASFALKTSDTPKNAKVVIAWAPSIEDFGRSRTPLHQMKRGTFWSTSFDVGFN